MGKRPIRTASGAIRVGIGHIHGGSATTTATDPRSDDLSFAWDWGDGSLDTATTYHEGGSGPRPVPEN